MATKNQTADSGTGKTMINWKQSLIFALFFSCATLAWSSANYPFDSAKKEAQFNHLLKNLRCLVCQNQDLADSNAELARDMRQQIYHFVNDNQSDTEIYNFLSTRYGDFILFQPPFKTLTLILWFGPLLFLIAGLVVFWRVNCRQVDL